MVYGGFASIIGHEIIHGFDTSGIKHNEEGNERPNWWDTKSKQEFNKRTKCMVDQYNNFTFNVGGKIRKVDGAATIDENMCDNGGVNIAYRYYLSHYITNFKNMFCISEPLRRQTKPRKKGYPQV